MRLNAIMALATVASVVGVMGSATVGSMSARHHYFQGTTHGSRQSNVRAEVTSQLTGDDEAAPVAFMLLSNLVAQPPGKPSERQAQSPADPGFGAEPITLQSFGSSYGGGPGGLDVGAGPTVAALVQAGPPDLSQPPDARPVPGGGRLAGDLGSIAGPGFPPEPGAPPTVDPPVPVLPQVPPQFPDPETPKPPVPPPPSPFVLPPEQTLASQGPPPPVATSAVPEPATWTMLVVGFALVGAAAPRRRARAPQQPPLSAA